MRARSFLVVGALTGCGIISGLDGLGVDDDASTDATTDGANDSNLDVATDDVNLGDGNITPNGSVLCGNAGACMAGQHCCFAKASEATCSSTDCPQGDIRYNCDNHNDCPILNTCCLANNVASCAATCDGSVLCIVDASPPGCGQGGGLACKPYVGGLPTTGVCN